MIFIILEKQYISYLRECQDMLIRFVRRLLANILRRSFHCLFSRVISTTRILYFTSCFFIHLERFGHFFTGGLPYSIFLARIVVAFKSHYPSTLSL